MNSFRLVLPIFTALLLCLPATGAGDQNDPRLDQLFDTLRNSGDDLVLLEAEAEIWEIWFDSGNRDVDTKMDMAGELMQAGDLAAAERIYTQVIDILPGFSEGWNRRATVRFYQRDFAGSLADIEETLRLEPRHFGAIWGLGMILGSQNDYERAILAFERLLEIKPNSMDARPRIEQLKQRMTQESI